MKLKGLVMLATPESFRDAYTHRAHKLGECLRKRSVHVDFFYIDDHTPMRINTLARTHRPEDGPALLETARY